MINLKDYIKVENIYYDFPAEDKNELFRKISENIAGKIQNADAELVYNKLMERERLHNTGIVNRVGLPHCYLDNINSVNVFIVILKNSIDYASPDGDPVKGAIFIVSDKSLGEEYLQVLSSVAYVLRTDRVRNTFLSAKSPGEVIKLFEKYKKEQMRIPEELKKIFDLQKIEYQIEYNEREEKITNKNKDIFKDKINELKKKKNKLEKSIEPIQLNHYRKLKRKYDNIITARIQFDNTCGYCNIQVPVHKIREVRKNDNIVTCSSCGKILY